MAALPASFLNPGTSFGVSLSITISGVQCRPDVYIGQKAVLAVTGSGGPAGVLAVLDSSVTGVLVFSKQPAKSSIATAIALTAHCLSARLIGVLHLRLVALRVRRQLFFGRGAAVAGAQAPGICPHLRRPIINTSAC